jgi:hypothetical protein
MPDTSGHPEILMKNWIAAFAAMTILTHLRGEICSTDLWTLSED